MNAAVRAVTRAALARGAEVFGVRNGYAGLLADAMKPLQARDVGGIVQHGGTVLGSARCPEFAEPSGRSAALRSLAARGIDGLVVIGGNGSQTGSAALAREGFAVVGVPSTIDNDVYGADSSIGADTAVNITLEAIDRLRTTASSHSRAFAVETMGRDCGYIALMAGIAGGAEVIALPESEIGPGRGARRLRAAYQRGDPHAPACRERRAHAAGRRRAARARSRDGDLGQPVEQLDLHQPAGLDLAAAVLEHDEAVRLRHRAQHARALLAGGAHLPLGAFA